MRPQIPRGLRSAGQFRSGEHSTGGDKGAARDGAKTDPPPAGRASQAIIRPRRTASRHHGRGIVRRNDHRSDRRRSEKRRSIHRRRRPPGRPHRRWRTRPASDRPRHRRGRAAPREDASRGRRNRSRSDRRGNRPTEQESALRLAGALQRELAEKRAFLPFPGSDSRSAARTFSECGYLTLDAVRDLGGRERGLSLTHVKTETRARGRNFLADIRMALEIFSWLEASAGIREAANTGFEEIDIAQWVSSGAVGFSSAQGLLAPGQDMGIFSRSHWKGPHFPATVRTVRSNGLLGRTTLVTGGRNARSAPGQMAG